MSKKVTFNQAGLDKYNAKWSGPSALTTRALYASASKNKSSVRMCNVQDHAISLLSGEGVTLKRLDRAERAWVEWMLKA